MLLEKKNQLVSVSFIKKSWFSHLMVARDTQNYALIEKIDRKIMTQSKTKLRYLLINLLQTSTILYPIVMSF